MSTGLLVNDLSSIYASATEGAIHEIELEISENLKLTIKRKKTLLTSDGVVYTCLTQSPNKCLWAVLEMYVTENIDSNN